MQIGVGLLQHAHDWLPPRRLLTAVVRMGCRLDAFGDLPHALDDGDLATEDRWVLGRLCATAAECNEHYARRRLNDAAYGAFNFFRHEFCDWYLEAIKPALYGKEGEARMAATRWVLWRVLKDTLVLLHPFIPFVTEEIWHKLPGTDGSIMQARFPLETGDDRLPGADAQAEADMELVTGIITAIRNIRGEMGISPSMALAVALQSGDEAVHHVAQQGADQQAADPALEQAEQAAEDLAPPVPGYLE